MKLTKILKTFNKAIADLDKFVVQKEKEQEVVVEEMEYLNKKFHTNKAEMIKAKAVSSKIQELIN